MIIARCSARSFHFGLGLDCLNFFVFYLLTCSTAININYLSDERNFDRIRKHSCVMLIACFLLFLPNLNLCLESDGEKFESYR